MPPLVDHSGYSRAAGRRQKQISIIQESAEDQDIATHTPLQETPSVQDYDPEPTKFASNRNDPNAVFGGDNEDDIEIDSLEDDMDECIERMDENLV
jgi:hypothetical protein